jgi:hypothetical protein
MKRWDARAERKNEWRIEHEARQDTNGILTDWHWWQVVGTNLNGAAVVMTRAYFWNVSPTSNAK